MKTTLTEPRSLKDLICTAETLAETTNTLLNKDRTSFAPVMEVFA